MGNDDALIFCVIWIRDPVSYKSNVVRNTFTAVGSDIIHTIHEQVLSVMGAIRSQWLFLAAVFGYITKLLSEVTSKKRSSYFTHLSMKSLPPPPAHPAP